MNRHPITTGELRDIIDSVVCSALRSWADDQIGEASRWIWRQVTSTALHAAAALDFPQRHGAVLVGPMVARELSTRSDTHDK